VKRISSTRGKSLREEIFLYMGHCPEQAAFKGWHADEEKTV